MLDRDGTGRFSHIKDALSRLTVDEDGEPADPAGERLFRSPRRCKDMQVSDGLIDAVYTIRIRYRLSNDCMKCILTSDALLL
jgi:hypothetical protein